MATEVKHKTPQGQTIILKKNSVNPGRSSLTELQKRNVIWEYTQDKTPVPTLASKYKVSDQVIKGIIRNFGSDFNNHTETMALIESQSVDNSVTSTSFKQSKPTFKSPALINKAFLSLLSDPHDPTLTEQEQTYAWIYAFTNNNSKALKDSGLVAGLNMRHSDRPDGKTTSSFQNACKMRGYYLRKKENIQRYIKELRESRLSDLKLDKGYIQQQLVTDIEHMNEEGDIGHIGAKLKAIHLLGQTIPGCFSETIKVETVSPDDALDQLLEMAKADVKQIRTVDDSEYTLIES